MVILSKISMGSAPHDPLLHADVRYTVRYGLGVKIEFAVDWRELEGPNPWDRSRREKLFFPRFGVQTEMHPDRPDFQPVADIQEATVVEGLPVETGRPRRAQIDDENPRPLAPEYHVLGFHPGRLDADRTIGRGSQNGLSRSHGIDILAPVGIHDDKIPFHSPASCFARKRFPE